MKIHDARNKDVEFRHIEEGDVFKSNGNYYLKMIKIPGYNAVRLSSGCPTRFDDDNEVCLLENAVLEIG